MRGQLQLTAEPSALKAPVFYLRIASVSQELCHTAVASVVSFVPLAATQACFRVTVPVCIELL